MPNPLADLAIRRRLHVRLGQLVDRVVAQRNSSGLAVTSVATVKVASDSNYIGGGGRVSVALRPAGRLTHDSPMMCGSPTQMHRRRWHLHATHLSTMSRTQTPP